MKCNQVLPGKAYWNIAVNLLVYILVRQLVLKICEHKEFFLDEKE